jgi:hypothetical protein
MLWNEAALNEARIPPGPRLLILHHLDAMRHPPSAAGGVLKPALLPPLPPLPPHQPAVSGTGGGGAAK